ncbi:hypothetical protein ACIRQP_36870 [Streptomyces sp. NPDC102274]|uniref:YunG family protein n=1 Tax=Streptomyces sp. NPDC102274 TaxID=3366151 RepID=UPI0038104A38
MWSPRSRCHWRRVIAGQSAWGHCDITALIVPDIFGGDLVVGEVHQDGEPQGVRRWKWNRLPHGVELGLTREQFQHGWAVTAARVVERPPSSPRRRSLSWVGSYASV